MKKHKHPKRRLIDLLFSLFCITVLVCFSSDIYALHIVGGSMTYECLNTNNSETTYRITLKIYRDCSARNSGQGGQPTPLDPQAAITIYTESGNSFIENFNVPLMDEFDVPEDASTCADIESVPIQPCVTEGLYQFDVTLPIISESYTITYQRCCRNDAINNISNAGSIGGTYMVEITAAAQNQLRCNSSPSFEDALPPLYTCANQDINFDFVATDADGDSLVYEFCSPFNGAARNDPRPVIASRPPYNTIPFRAPTYTSSRPLGGDPTVIIDPNTGHMSGTPTAIGLFAVGLCVKEYRDGLLLSTIRRDFQYTVVECGKSVDVKIDSENEQVEVIEDTTNPDMTGFNVISCGSKSITFDNISSGQDETESYQWFFNINGQIQEFEFSTNQSLTIDFPDFGSYEGKMIANPGLECADSAQISITINPSLEPNFSFDYDTCVAGPVTFTDLSIANESTIQEWTWDFKDGNISTEKNPEYSYPIPGIFDVELEIIDNNSCVQRITKEISYQPAPALLIVEPSSFAGCNPLNVFFNNLSTPIDSTYSILWNFGDGETSTDISPIHTYEISGDRDVSLEVTSPIGCKVSEFFPNLISVTESPETDFDLNLESQQEYIATYSFEDLSVDAVTWFWDFGDGITSVLENPIHTYQDTGYYIVTLISTRGTGCQDTAIQHIDINPKLSFFMPNAFTPNNDDENDGFKGKGFIPSVSNFKMSVWNRWGNLVFETTDPEIAWNGRKNNSGRILQAGVYVYFVSYYDPASDRQINFQGYTTLIK